MKEVSLDLFKQHQNTNMKQMWQCSLLMSRKGPIAVMGMLDFVEDLIKDVYVYETGIIEFAGWWH